MIPVESPGFSGTKKDGYRAACDALYQLVGTGDTTGISKHSINLLGEFNIAGETYMMKDYFRRLGIEVVSCITGDGRVDEPAAATEQSSTSCNAPVPCCISRSGWRATTAFLSNGFPSSASRTPLPPYDAAGVFGDPELEQRARNLVSMELARIQPELRRYRKILKGKRPPSTSAARSRPSRWSGALRTLGMRTALVGSQTGNPKDYEQLRELCDPGTIIVDDSNCWNSRNSASSRTSISSLAA